MTTLKNINITIDVVTSAVEDPNVVLTQTTTPTIIADSAFQGLTANSDTNGININYSGVPIDPFPSLFKYIEDYILISDDINLLPYSGMPPVLDSLSVVDFISFEWGYGRSLTDTVPVLDLKSFDVGKIALDTSVVTDTKTFNIGKDAVDTATTTDIASKDVSKTLSETLALTDSVIFSLGFGRTYTDTVTTSDTSLLAIGKAISDTIAMSDVIPTFQIYKSLSDIVNITDSFQTNISGLLTGTYSETSNISEVIALAFSKYLTDENVAVTDTSFRSVGKNVANEVITTSDTASHAVDKVVTENIAINEVISKVISKVIQDTVGVTDVFSNFLTRDYGMPNDLSTVIDSTLFNINKVLAEYVPVLDYTYFNFSKLMPSDNVAVSDTSSRTVGKNTSENVTATDTSYLGIGKATTENLVATDSNTKTFSKLMPSEGVVATDTPTKNVGKVLTAENITATDAPTKSVGKVLQELATLSDSNTFNIGLNLVDVLALTDSIEFSGLGSALESSASETLALLDELANSFQKVITSGQIRVDSSTDVVERTADLPTGDFTIAGWFRHAGTTSQDEQAFITIGGTGQLPLCSLQMNATRIIELKMATSTDTYEVVSTGYTFSTNEWLYLALSSSGTAPGSVIVEIWTQTGLKKNTATNTLTAKSGTFTYINLCNDKLDTTNWANGTVKNVRVWDAALTDAELTNEMFASLPIRTENLNTAFIDNEADISGNNRNWTLTGTTRTFGNFPVDSYVLLDSTADYIRRNSDLPSPHAVTISGWFKRTITKNTWTKLAVLSIDTWTSSISIGKNDSNSWMIECNGVETHFTNTIEYNKWYYFALTCSGSGANQLKGYFFNADGSLLETVSATGPTTFTPTRMQLGSSYWDANEYLGGLLAYCRVWNAALSQAELEKELKTVSPARTADIYNYFKIWALYDHSGNGRTWNSGGLSYVFDNGPPVLIDSADVVTAKDVPTKAITKKIRKGSLIIPSTGTYLRRTSSLPPSTSFTIAGWFKRTGDLSTSRVVFRLGDASTRIILRYHQPSAQYMIDNGVVDESMGDFQALTTDWTYFAMTSDGTGASAIKAYAWNKSGELLGSYLTLAGSDFTPTTLNVGSTDDLLDAHIGNIAHIRLWNTPLTQAQLEKEMFSITPMETSLLNTAFVDNGVDISGNNRDWTMSGLTYDIEGPPWNTFISINSSGDIIDRTTDLPASDAFTMAGWVYIPKNPSVDINSVFTLGTVTPSNKLHWIQWDNNPNGDYIFRTESLNSGPISSIGSAPPDNWYYVTIKTTTTGTAGFTAKVWNAQGTAIGSRTLDSEAFTPTTLRIGGYFSTTAYRGIGWLYAHVRVWDAYLSEAELLKEMFSSNPVRTANLNTAFKNNPLIDISGNNRPWTLSGTVYGSSDTCPVDMKLGDLVTVKDSGSMYLQGYFEDSSYLATIQDYIGITTTF